MRRAKNRAPKGRQKSIVVPFNAPILGWFSNGSKAASPPDSAIILDNWFCNTNDVRMRRGYTEHSDTGAAGNVETLMPYHGAASTMFAAADGEIYDVTVGDPGSADVTGLSNDRWQCTNFPTAANQFLICVNGEDTPQNYDGTSWATTPLITGVTPSALIDVWNYKNRLWFVEDNTTDVWFLPVDSIGGVAQKLACGGYLKNGGKILAGGTWSSDAGDGNDDRLVVVSNQGEALIFTGTDPTNALLWGFVGRFDVARPIGTRCLFRIGGDLLVITEEGVLPVSRIVQIDQAVTRKVSLTGNIHPEFVNAAVERNANFGWQLVSYPAESMAILNVPAASQSGTNQFVMNVISGAWSRYSGWEALCWLEFEGAVYYGGTDGKVNQAETGSSDNGVSIEATMLPAFSHLGYPGVQKHVKQIRPFVSSNSEITPSIAVATDFEEPAQLGGTVGIDTDFFTWDSSVWDGPDLWQGTSVSFGWRTGGGLGIYISPALYVSVDGAASGGALDYSVISFDVVFEPGHTNG